ncbi:Thioredoxin-like [bacterium A37T11]|nr:Thioredoxin-like [bacterium A37T11]
MNKFLLFVLSCAPVLSHGQAAHITFKSKQAAGQAVKILAPLNGQFFWGMIQNEMLDSTGILVLENRETVPGVYTFYCNGSYSLYVRPNQDYVVTVNADKKDRPLSIASADSAGQLQLNKLSSEFYQTVGMNYYKADTSFVNNKARVQAALDSCMRVFTQLKRNGQIDDGFLQFVSKKAKAYYASVLGASLIPSTHHLVFKKDSAAYDAGRIRLMQARWRELATICDVSDPDNTGPGEYIDYANLINMWLVGYIQGSLNGTFKKFKTQDDYEQFHYDNIQQSYKGKLAEYLSASHLAYLLLEEKFLPQIPKEYKAFTTQYPHSPYTSFMKPGMEKLLAYQEKSKEDYTPQQKFVPTYDSINTFDAVVAYFPGKTLFIDLWATWCGPCKAEFGYNKELRAFLKAKNIVPLYISIDREEDEQRWKDMIKYYDLQGYHLRANPELMKDIRRLFSNKDVLSIPRYVLIKDRKIVGLSMKAPSEKEALYKQLESYL